jgi:hypothetical protein
MFRERIAGPQDTGVKAIILFLLLHLQRTEIRRYYYLMKVVIPYLVRN